MTCYRTVSNFITFLSPVLCFYAGYISGKQRLTDPPEEPVEPAFPGVPCKPFNIKEILSLQIMVTPHVFSVGKVDQKLKLHCTNQDLTLIVLKLYSIMKKKKHIVCFKTYLAALKA